MVSSNSTQPSPQRALMSPQIKFFATMVIIVALGGCSRSESLELGSGTRWVSQEGYSVELGPHDVYTFCDGTACFNGKYLRPGAESSIALVLKDFYLRNETKRFQARLISLGSEHSAIKISYPDLDFTETGGRAPEKWCDNKPCVLFGSVTTSDNLVFYRQ